MAANPSEAHEAGLGIRRPHMAGRPAVYGSGRAFHIGTPLSHHLMPTFLLGTDHTNTGVKSPMMVAIVSSVAHQNFTPV
jgi:hypothetical protein